MVVFSSRFLNQISAFEQHKGQKGSICVIGGSFEYSGAPYFSAISALRTGVDLSFVICDKNAAPVIKSYSPELIVYGILDGEQSRDVSIPLNVLKRACCFVIGPGLSRNQNIFDQVKQLLIQIDCANSRIIFDGDGIESFCQFCNFLTNSTTILTPNYNEFKLISQKLNVSEILKTSRIYRKDETDVLLWQDKKMSCTTEGTPRRCGGLGDVLSGVIAAIISMLCTLKNYDSDDINYCILFAGELVRKASRLAYEQKSRGMSALDVIANLPQCFDEMTQ